MGPITDFHTHAFPDELASEAIDKLRERQREGAHGPHLAGTTADLRRSMDRAGIQRSVICSIATAPTQVEPIIKWSTDIQGPRLIPFGSVHPESRSPDDDVQAIAEAGLRGVKLHPLYQGYDLADPELRPLFELIEEHDLVLVVHCGLDFAFPPDDERAHPEKVLAIHENFPGIRLVAAHMGGWRRWEVVLDTLAGRKVYLETSYTIGYADDEVLQELVRVHPTDRILFGTDSPWQGQKETLEKVRALFPDQEDRRLVLCENACHLLNDTP
ncbi:MAG: amidohydrolase family protein [Planctomycetota bacterium]